MGVKSGRSVFLGIHFATKSVDQVKLTFKQLRVVITARVTP